MSINKKLLEILKPSTAYQNPTTFYEELHRLSNLVVLPMSVLAIISWLLFIELDQAMYPHRPLLLFLRLSFTGAGVISFILYLLPFFKKHGYWLIIGSMACVGLATGAILGMVEADPIYMGGYAIVIPFFSLVPIKRSHAFLLLLCSLVTFKIVGTYYNMEFVGPEETYGLYNLIVSVGACIPAIATFDLMRRKTYEKSRLLRLTNKDLQKANELKNQLLQMAAHDLKDPLQVIIGYTDLLQMRFRSEKFAAEKLRIIHRSTERMIKLIGGLLEITSIESGKLAMHKDDVDMEEVVSAASKSYLQAAQKKNQKLHWSVNGDCKIHGDKMLLRQVVNNVIDNAVKFSPPGKSIWVDLHCLETNLVLKVRDEGPGLTNDELEKIFDKFQRLTPKPTMGEIATGIGLSITRDLVQLHGGTIFVESEPGKGCTFIINFPITQAPKEETGEITE